MVSVRFLKGEGQFSGATFNYLIIGAFNWSLMLIYSGFTEIGMTSQKTVKS